MTTKIVVQAARTLHRMMRGDRLTLTMLEQGGDGPQRAALRSRMRALVDGLPWARRSAPGRGTTEEFWWEWPMEQASRPEQVWALAASRALLAAYSGTEIGRVLDELLEEHRARLPSQPPPQSDLSRMYFASSRMLDPLGLDADVVDAVAQATSQHRQLRFDYTQFSGDRFPVVVEPWTVLLADEGLYIYGRCVECDAKAHHIDTQRVYRVSRIRKPRILPTTFIYPVRAEYDPASVFAHSWDLMLAPEEAGGPSTVTLRFAPVWTTYLQDQKIHPTQGDVETDQDGHLVVSMRLHVTHDLVRWVRGHGNDVEVLSPANLAGWVASGDGGGTSSYERWVLAPDRPTGA